ncbi:MAG: hypothetical protein IKN38_08395, partial [Clostridia bacterium]|nr:hypothetical protein [Clostridia bacterium]
RSSDLGGDSEETGSSDNPSSSIDEPQFKNADYGGEDFIFATFTSKVGEGNSAHEYYCGNWIDCDELTGTAIDDAVYKRNIKCEEKYHVEIKNEIRGEDYGDYNDLIFKGGVEWDVVYGWASRLAVGVTDNVFYDFRMLDEAGIIDMEDASYWQKNVNDSLMVADRNFLAINDIAMSTIAWTGCVFFNPKIIEDYGLENPHDLVDSNQWTVDKFLEMVKSVHGDLDGAADFTFEDQYGLIDMGAMMSLIYGSDIHLADDADYLNIGNDRVYSLIQKVRAVLDDRQFVFDYDSIVNGVNVSDPWEHCRSYFSNGHSLFVTGTPELTREFRDMETGYGIVPLPKFDANQTNYVACIDSNAGVFALPNSIRRDATTASYDRTGTILEYLAYKSSEDNADSLLNKYYETTIKSQRQTIEKNKEMLDKYVKAGGHFEWCDVFNVGAVSGKEGTSISGVLGTMSGSANAIQSTYRKSEKRLQKAIDDLITAIDNLTVDPID